MEIPPHKYKHMSKNHQIYEENQQHEKELTLEETECAGETRETWIILSNLREMRGYHKNKMFLQLMDPSGWKIETIIIIPHLHK